MIEIKGPYSIHVLDVDMSRDLTNIPTSSGKSLDLPGVHECPNLYKCIPWTYLGSINVLTSTSVDPGPSWGR